MAQRRRGELLGNGGGGPLLGSGASGAGGPSEPNRGRGWTVARQALLTSARQKQSMRNLGNASGGGLNFEGMPVSIPEEDAETDLHLAFRTQSSLSVIKEYFYMAVEENGGREYICGETDASGRLLLHCIGLNHTLILNADGSINTTTAGLAEDFILNELLPSYPSAIIEEDDDHNLPFMQPILSWAQDRQEERRKAAQERESSTNLADIVQEAAKAFFSKRTLEALGRGSGATQDGSLTGGNEHFDDEAQVPASTYDLPPDVEWCLGMLSHIITSKLRPRPVNRSGHFDPNSSADGLFNESAASFGDVADLISEGTASKSEAEFDSLFVINEEGTIEMVNDEASKEFGWTREEFIGNNISMICGGGHGPKHDQYLKNYLKTGIKKVMGKHDRILHARRKDGSEFEISLGITETPGGSGLPRRFCGFVKHKKKGAGRPSTKEEGPATSSRGFARLRRTSLGLDSHSDLSSLGKRSNRGVYQFGAVYNELIVEHVSQIKGIVKELLLIEDESTRDRVFQLSIVQQVLLCPDSFGDGSWLINLLTSRSDVAHYVSDVSPSRESSMRGSALFRERFDQENHDIDPAECAVFYLERISILSIIDDSSNMSGAVSRAGAATAASMIEMRTHLYDSISNLEGIIRSLCALENNLLKRVAVTRVVQRALDRKIFSPFALTAALFDGVFHLLFIATFRLGPAEAMFHFAAGDACFPVQQYLLSSIVLIASIGYFTRQKIHLIKTKKFTREETIKAKILNPWSFLTEILPILLASYCIIVIDWHLRWRSKLHIDDSSISFSLRSAVALTTPLLWVRVLGHLKMFNKPLATFVLCSVEIMRDIKWFMLVLIIIIASFAQMLVSLTFDGYDQDATAGSLTTGFFSFESYLKAYTLMLGDVDMEFLQAHSGIVILFVLYTFGVTVVLLNILIAIVSESYANAVYSSSLMLGKARILFVSDIMAMKSRYQLKKGGAIEKSSNRNAVVALVLSAVWIKSIINTVLIKLESMKMVPPTLFFGLSTIEIEAMIIFFVLFGIIRTHKAAMTYSLAISPCSLQERRASDKITAFSILAEKLQAYIGRNIDSLMDSDGVKNNQAEISDVNVASHGKVANDRRMQRALVATRKDLKAEIKTSADQMRHIIQETEDKTQASIAICENHLSSSLADVVSMQERIDSAIAASEERIIQALSSKLERILSEGRPIENGNMQPEQE